MSDFSTSLKTVVTRKDHPCDCFQRYRESGYCIYDIPEMFQDAVREAGELDGIIPAGTECYMWSGKFDGRMFTSHSFKGMHSLICYMDWFD